MEAYRHLDWLAEFARDEKAVGGPDPQLETIAAMSEGIPRRDHVWRALLYGSVYNVPTTEVLWRDWTPGRVIDEPVILHDYLVQNWKGLAFRRERRAVRTPGKLAEYIMDAAEWTLTWSSREWFHGGDPILNYETAWRDVQEVKYLGRYVALKVLEYMRRYAGARIMLHDIRPRGGWSPRVALGLLYPDQDEALIADTREGEALSNQYAALILQELWDRDIDVSWFEFQVLLCEYRECHESQRQYPGRSHDSELAYWRKISPYWGETGMLEARKARFPHEALGELHGWDGPREELGTFLRQTGRMWSDLRYDYHVTGGLPVERV